MFYRFFIVIILGIALSLLSGCSSHKNDVMQGYVEGELVYVSSEESGTLETLNIHRGEIVNKGHLLFKLDLRPQIYDVGIAKAKKKSAAATLMDITLGARPDELDQIKAQMEATRAAATFYKKQSERFKKLSLQKVGSQEDYDQAKFLYESSSAKFKENEASLRLAKLGQRMNQIRAQAYTTESEKINVEKQKYLKSEKIKHTHLAHAIVFDTYYLPGEYVPFGSPVTSLLAPENIHIVFFVPEPKLSTIKLGQKIKFSCDSCKIPTTATISYISPEPEYTPPVIYSNDMRYKLVYEVKAQIDPKIALQFHPGQPVDVDINQ
ncbi:MAG: HlyD family secretion protein [Gammaproteobacteria bacterium]